MGWRHPWFTITDDFDKDFDCDMWHATNAFIRDENDRVFRTYAINGRGDEVFVGTWNLLDMTALGRQEDWEDSPEAIRRVRPMSGGAGMTPTRREGGLSVTCDA